MERLKASFSFRDFERGVGEDLLTKCLEQNISVEDIAKEVDTILQEAQLSSSKAVKAYRLQLVSFLSEMVAFSQKIQSYSFPLDEPTRAELTKSLKTTFEIDLSDQIQDKDSILRLVNMHVRTSFNAHLDKGVALKRAEVLHAVRSSKREVEALLNVGQQQAARILCSTLLSALPPPIETDGSESFWGSLQTDEERKEWGVTIKEIGECMWESSARTGAYPLPPQDAFELEVVLPLIQRKLFEPRLETYANKLKDILATYKTGEKGVATLAKLRKIQKYYEALRKEELKKEVEKTLKEQWKEDDKSIETSLKTFKEDVKEYEKELAKYNREDDSFQRYSWRRAAPLFPTRNTSSYCP